VQGEQVHPPPLPARDPRGHKGTFGTVAVIGGCAETPRRMIGAPALAALGALRAGVGLVRLVMPAPILDGAIAMCPGATGRQIPVDREGCILGHEAAAAIDEQAGLCDCLVIGPGLGESEGARAAAVRAVQQEACPVVVDADALNRLAEVPELTRDFHAAAVLTPHPGEFRRLGAALNIDADPTEEGGRAAGAALLAQRLGCIVVLKGPGTVVSDGQRSWISMAENPALATAGTGDVLSGVIAGIMAQFVPGRGGATGRPLDLFAAACLGVQTHVDAAVLWARSRAARSGMLAVELADQIPAAMERMRLSTRA
jgi:ADP-dependent NAD(P)H-hydrate dehydratase